MKLPKITNPAAGVWNCVQLPIQHADSPVIVWHEKILVDDEYLFGEPESETRRECCKQAQATLPSMWYLLGGA